MKIKILLGVLSVLAILGMVFMAKEKAVEARGGQNTCGSAKECQCKNLGISSCGQGSSCRTAGSGCRCGK